MNTPFNRETHAIASAKRALRARSRTTLASLSPARFVDGGATIAKRAFELDELRRASVVVAFVPMRRNGRPIEADVTTLLDAITAAGKRLALPRGTADSGLEACQVGKDWRAELIESSVKDVLEPGPAAHPIPLDTINVVFVPGLAFDPLGGRLGRGKGFYDRFLAGLKPPAPHAPGSGPTLIGVCLEEQIAHTVPREPHDALMDCILTDVRTMRRAPSKE